MIRNINPNISLNGASIYIDGCRILLTGSHTLDTIERILPVNVLRGPFKSPPCAKDGGQHVHGNIVRRFCEHSQSSRNVAVIRNNKI